VGLFDAEHSSAAQRFPQLASCIGNAKPARNQTPNIKQPENGLLVPRGSKVSYFKSDTYIVNTSEGNELTVNCQKPHFLEVNTGNAHIKWFANLGDQERCARCAS
jgi:hypothetical protein